MKRKFKPLLLAIFAGTLLLAACSNSNTTAPKSSQPAESATASPGASSSPSVDPLQGADLTKLPDAAKKRTDTLIVGLTDPSGAFTPYFHQSGYDGNVSSLLFASLITVDESGLPVPHLAEKYEVSADQLTYTFTLRKDSKFSDGSPLTADDIAFTWTLLHDKAYDGDEDIIREANIKGGQAYKDGKAAAIEGIKIIDPQTISVTLEKPIATAIFTLGSKILSKAYYGKDYKFGNLDYIKNLHAAPLGNGPYKLEKFIPGQEVRFTANEHYFKGAPNIKNFIYKTSDGDSFQFVETGEIDFAGFTATQENIDKLKSLPFLKLLPYTPSTYGYIQLNLEKEHLKDKKVRQALVYGLDRQSIYVDSTQGANSIANIPSSPISWSYTEDGINKYEFDLEKAKTLLDEAGWTVGKDGIREKDGQSLKFHYLGSKSAQTDTFIAVVQEHFKTLGIDFQPEVFADFNALISKVESGDYDAASFSTPMLTDPSDGLSSFINGEIKGYDNPKVKELYTKALETTVIDERKAIYKELYQLLNDELPVIFTNYRKTIYAYNGRIENLSVSPFRGITVSLPDWKLSELK
ncbi:ABC transporter substrate-binding protein [Paenibacillus sp. GCM10027627]|uniref:ABC transporter substrate-binding protein n=1 Tax=unclassified Paenibacillus TaxID=185978 RepID=UPI0036255E9D